MALKVVKTVIEFFNRFSRAPKVKISLFSLISGITYALALASINSTIQHVSAGNDSLKVHLLVMFVLSCLIHVLFKRRSVNMGTVAAENLIRNVKVDITGKIRNSELPFIEKIGKGTLYTRLTESTDAISQGAPPLFLMMESIFSLLAIFCYIAYLSVVSLVMITVVGAVLYFAYSRYIAAATGKLNRSDAKEAQLFDCVNDILYGFKEIRINYKKNNDLFSDIQSISEESAGQKTEASIALDNSMVLMMSSYFIIVIGTIFILPVLGVTQKETITSLVSSMLFLWGPIVMIFMLSRQFTMLVIAIRHLNELDAMFEDIKPEYPGLAPVPGVFTEISLNGVEYCYRNSDGEPLFRIGPINFSFKKGEIVFITGGNGSGKSTLMKLLTGLYYPEPGGAITLEKERIADGIYQRYRELFATIFTDFHIFEKLYGLENIDETTVNDLLRRMEIDHKTKYVEDKFTNILLSTGQRKRVAYISAVLEEKQIYVFDEWAADQDPEFRKKFYTLFLEDMRTMGKTVIAVSHDDQYFHTADRIVKMDEGKSLAV